MKIYLGMQPAEHKTVLEPYDMEKAHMNLLVTYYKYKEYDLLKDFENTRLMIDSGAFTFNSKGEVNPKKINKYALDYRKFVKKVTKDDRVDGIFDLDIEPIGENNIKALREKLFEVSDKIIPVWHYTWGVKDYMKMCKQYDYVAIPCANTEIREKGLPTFVKYAHKHDCKIHALGMTTQRVLDKIPFDSTDSMTWVNSVIYSYYDLQTKDKKKQRVRLQSDFTRNNRQQILRGMFLKHLEMANHYYEKWRWYHGD